MVSPRSGAGSWRVFCLAAATLLLVASCSDRATEPSLSAAARMLLRDAVQATVFAVEPTLMTIPTYDGSGQAVHPDVVAFDAPWHGAQYWLTMTPYPK